MGVDRVDVEPQALVAAREAAGLTQHELAIAIGVSGGAMVSKWERGSQQPRPELLYRLAGALRVEVVDLQPQAVRDDPDLRALRVRLGVSRATMSRATGIPVRTLADWEGGVGTRLPSEPDLDRLAGYLRVSSSAVVSALASSRQGRLARRS